MEERATTETRAYVARYLLCFWMCYNGSQVSANEVEVTTLAEASEEQNALQQALLLVELLKLEYARVLRVNNEMLRTNEFEQTNILRQDDLLTCATTSMNPEQSSPNTEKEENENTTPNPSQWSRSRRIQRIPRRSWRQYAPDNGYNLYYDIPARRYFNNDFENEENVRGWRRFSYEDPFGPQPGNANLEKTSPKTSFNSPTYTTSSRGTSTSVKIATTTSKRSTSTIKIFSTTTLTTSTSTSETPRTTSNSTSATEPLPNTNVNTVTSPSATSTTNAIKESNHTLIKSSSSSLDTQRTSNNKLLNLKSTHYATTTALNIIAATSPKILHLTKRLSLTKVTSANANVPLTQNSSTSKPVDMKKLSHKINNQVANEPELSQAAAELENELNANFGKPFSTRNGISRKLPFLWPGTTKIYLSRSSRYPIPLPENNAFCHSNPDSALCRTFI